MNEPENISELFSPGSGVVKREDEEERHGSGHTTRQDVHGELLGLAGILGGGEGDLNGILEGKVKSLSREVSEHIGQVSSPEGVDSLSLEHSGGAVNDTSVRLVKTSLLDHLILVLPM